LGDANAADFLYYPQFAKISSRILAGKQGGKRRIQV